MSLPPQGVAVVWDWEWLDDEIDYISETSSEGIAAINPSMESRNDADQSSDECSYNSLSATHTVTFKCIDTTHDSVSQHVLQKVSSLLHKGETVPVDIFPEPDNPYGSKAIAFKCFLDGQWKRIGYIVREALASVHSALSNRKIAGVAFSWANYLVTWPRSGPGYYAGINISIYGQWPMAVVSCASSR